MLLLNFYCLLYMARPELNTFPRSCLSTVTATCRSKAVSPSQNLGTRRTSWNVVRAYTLCAPFIQCGFLPTSASLAGTDDCKVSGSKQHVLAKCIFMRRSKNAEVSSCSSSSYSDSYKKQADRCLCTTSSSLSFNCYANSIC